MVRTAAGLLLGACLGHGSHREDFGHFRRDLVVVRLVAGHRRGDLIGLDDHVGVVGAHVGRAVRDLDPALHELRVDVVDLALGEFYVAEGAVDLVLRQVALRLTHLDERHDLGQHELRGDLACRLVRDGLRCGLRSLGRLLGNRGLDRLLRLLGGRLRCLGNLGGRHGRLSGGLGCRLRDLHGLLGGRLRRRLHGRGCDILGGGLYGLRLGGGRLLFCGFSAQHLSLAAIHVSPTRLPRRPQLRKATLRVRGLLE